MEVIIFQWRYKAEDQEREFSLAVPKLYFEQPFTIAEAINQLGKELMNDIIANKVHEFEEFSIVTKPFPEM